jgi:hypothetical protein
MLGVATVAAVFRGTNKNFRTVQPAPPRPRAGTAQANLVNTLHDYRIGLEMLQQAPHPRAIAATAVQATEAARAAETTAIEIARAVDKLDDAITRAGHIARQTVHSTGVQESAQRMKKQRQDLLAGLTTAVAETGEVYTKLLELATTTDMLGVHLCETGEARQVNQTLDVIRGVFVELEALQSLPAEAADTPTGRDVT